jgi:hypothetical protein
MAASGNALLVLLKPDGDRRVCTTAEVELLTGAWDDLLSWLRGVDPDDLTHSALIGAVATKAGLRMVRFREYDIRSWAAEAARLGTTKPPFLPTGKELPLVDVVAAHLNMVGFALQNETRTWLNRVAIDLLYRDAPKFHDNWEILVPQLLNGPVTIQYWHGAHCGLALALKLLARRALSTALTNLLHVELVTDEEVHLISRTLEATG